MFVYAGIRSSYLMGQEIDIQFQLQQLAETQVRLNSTLDKLYAYAQVEPGTPQAAQNDLLMQNLFAWQKQVNFTQTRLQQQIAFIQAEKPKQDEQFKKGVKSFYDMLA
jgi:hypothetical protein